MLIVGVVFYYMVVNYLSISRSIKRLELECKCKYLYYLFTIITRINNNITLIVKSHYI